MSYSLSLRELAELLDDPDACGENLDPWEAGSSLLEIAVVEALPSMLTLINDLGEALEQANAWDDPKVSFGAYEVRYKGCLSYSQRATAALAVWNRAKEK